VFSEPTQGPLPAYLKLSRTRGIIGETTTTQIQGFPFYIGALGYSVRLGLEGPLVADIGGGMCFMEVEMPGLEQGVQSVWVSAYGFGPPWVLAGFFFWQQDPHQWEGCVQPGFPCNENASCCQTEDVPTVCENGRCLQPE
jgi:hypothetical protein